MDGKVIYQAHPNQKQAMSPAIAWMIAQTARGVIERGTAASAKSLGLTRYAAGKTGTTDDYKDAWFVGFTNSLTCGVWVGFDQPQPIQERGYGATLALPIWVKTMEKASRQKYPDGPFAAPEPLVSVRLCSVSNRLATNACPPPEILTRSRCLNRLFQLNPVRFTTVDNSANQVDPGI